MNPVDLGVLTLPLRGQSRHTANFVAMYEKGDWSARLADNWRSKYLLTTRDAISGAPIGNDDQGFLDGSVSYAVKDNITGGLQSANSLDTQADTSIPIDH